jgi:hypothetical protein
VAVPAVDALVADVVAVIELHRLIDRIHLLREVGAADVDHRSRDGPPPSTSAITNSHTRKAVFDDGLKSELIPFHGRPGRGAALTTGGSVDLVGLDCRSDGTSQSLLRLPARECSQC